MNPEEEKLLALVANCEPHIVPFLMKQLVARVGGEPVRTALSKALPKADDMDDGPLFMQVAEFLHYVGEIPPLLVDNLIPEKALVLITGKPKAGKSLLALDIADSVSRGNPVFGSYTVNTPGVVGYIGMEDGEKEISRRLRYRGFEDSDVDQRFHVAFRRFRLNDPRNLDKVKEWYDLIQPVLILVDTARESLGIKDWNNAGEVSDAVRPLREFARNNCTIILVAHNRKGVSEDSGDQISGSNAFTSSVDGWISADKVEEMPNRNRRMHLSVNGRGGMDGSLVVEMDTKNTHFRLVPPNELGGEAASHDRADKQRRWQPYLQALEAMPAATATITALAEVMNYNRKTVERVVKEMVEAGEVKAVGGPDRMDGMGRPSQHYTRNPF